MANDARKPLVSCWCPPGQWCRPAAGTWLRHPTQPVGGTSPCCTQDCCERAASGQEGVPGLTRDSVQELHLATVCRKILPESRPKAVWDQ